MLISEESTTSYLTYSLVMCLTKNKLITSWIMSGLLPLLELSKDSRCPVFQARGLADGDGHDHHHYQVWIHTWHKVTIDGRYGGGGHTELTWVDIQRPQPAPVYQLYSVLWREKKRLTCTASAVRVIDSSSLWWKSNPASSPFQGDTEWAGACHGTVSLWSC